MDELVDTHLMEINAVPQDDNATLSGQRKATYARDEYGRMVIVASRGWEAEEIVTVHALAAFHAQAEAARERVMHGHASPLEYWMYASRMDVATLAQSTGFWRWRVRQHLQPSAFAKLSQNKLSRYAAALGLASSALQQLP